MKLNKLLALGLLTGLMLGACTPKDNRGGEGSSGGGESSGSQGETHWYDDYVAQGATFSASFPLSAVKTWYGNENMEFVSVPDSTGYAYLASASSFIVMAEGDVASTVLGLFSDTTKYAVDTTTYQSCAMVDPVDHTWHLDVYYADTGEDTQMNFLPVCLDRTTNTAWTEAEQAIFTEELGDVLPFFAFGSDYVVSTSHAYAMYWVEMIEAAYQVDEDMAIYYAELMGYITEDMLGDGIYISDSYVYDLGDDLDDYLTSTDLGFTYDSDSGIYGLVSGGSCFTAYVTFNNPGNELIITKSDAATGLTIYEEDTEDAITEATLEQGGFISLEIWPNGAISSVPEYTLSSETALSTDEEYYDMETYSWMGAIYLEVTVASDAEVGDYTITFDVNGNNVVFTIHVIAASE